MWQQPKAYKIRESEDLLNRECSSSLVLLGKDLPQPVSLFVVVECKVRHLENLISLTKTVVATEIVFVCLCM